MKRFWVIQTTGRGDRRSDFMFSRAGQLDPKIVQNEREMGRPQTFEVETYIG